MKTRQGFVSNSSSMSFVILGQNVDLWDDLEGAIRNKNLWAIGTSWGEGWDVFRVSSEMLMEIRNTENHCHLDLVESYKVAYIDGPGDSVDMENDLPRTFQVFSVEKSQHSVSDGDIEEFKKRYMQRKP